MSGCDSGATTWMTAAAKKYATLQTVLFVRMERCLRSGLAWSKAFKLVALRQ